MTKIITRLTFSALALSAAFGTAAAQVSAKQTVVTETVSRAPDGTETLTRVPAERVIPGDRIAYVLTYENAGDAPADEIVLVMPIPPAVTLSVGAETGGRADYSVDGGENWGEFAALSVERDGQTRAAAPTDVTHLRWRIAQIAPGATGEVAYRAVLR